MSGRRVWHRGPTLGDERKEGRRESQKGLMWCKGNGWDTDKTWWLRDEMADYTKLLFAKMDLVTVCVVRETGHST